jgi:phosphate transport system permease protein
MASTIAVRPASGIRSSFWSRLKSGDQAAYLISLLFAASVLLIAVLLVIVLWNQSVLARERFGLGFFASRAWNHDREQYGALPFVYGTLITSAIALVISVPLGVGAAIFLSELAPPRISNGLTFLVELLAAVPSVIYGLLAFFLLVPFLRSTIDPALKAAFGWTPLFTGPIYGTGYLAAGVILSVMTFPFIISVSREALLEVPREQREAALALGATRWEATWQAVVPFAKLGIMGSIFLGLARALGETMAVTMVIGNAPTMSPSLLSPGYTIASVIANEFAEANNDIFRQSLIFMGLVLFLLTIVINGAARLLIIATTRKGAS